MATKLFAIETPEQLKALAEFARDWPNNLLGKARVWAATQRRQGKTPWDNSIYAMFSGTRSRDAAVVHLKQQAEMEEVPIRYNKALNWCEQNLRQVHDEGTEG